MAGYVAINWVGEAPASLPALREQLPDDWRVGRADAETLIIVRGEPGPQIRTLPGARGFVLGDLYNASHKGVVGDEIISLAISRAASIERVLGDLSARFWGRYVALVREVDGGWAVFRDPSGALEAMTWSVGALRLTASHLPDWLPAELWPPDLAVDWDAVGAWLQASAAIGARSALNGIAAVTPGAVRRQAGEEQQIWSPADAACVGPPSDPEAALRETVDACVRALVGDEAVLAEVSGGLDSAILASSLAAQVPDQVLQWTNYFVEGRRGDERSYARDVAARWGFALTEVLKPDFAVTELMLARLAGGLRPGLSAKDAARDAEAAERARSLGAGRIVTGQGGDMVFFATPTPVLVVDHMRERGPLAWASPFTLNVARWSRRSVWSTPGLRWRQELKRHNRSVVGHPWMAGVENLPPAKQMQIATLAHKLTIHIEGLRGRAAEVIHPLLSQPVVELCLSLPTPVLAAGGRDRGLARQAFAERLPSSVRERRSKGELGAYYGQVAAASLPMLRSYLLDGELVRAGLLDRARLETMLVRDHLIWRGDYSALISFAVVEAWVRHWSARICAARGADAAAGARVSASQASTLA